MGKKKSKDTLKGIDIQRKGTKFIATWKVPSGGYKDLDLFINVNGATEGKGKKKHLKWNRQDKKKGDNWGKKTSFTKDVPHAKTSVSVKVHAHEKGKKETKTHSDTFKIELPKVPKAEAEWNKEHTNETKFKFTITETGVYSHYWYLNYAYKWWTCYEGSKGSYSKEETGVGTASGDNARTFEKTMTDGMGQNGKAFARVIEVKSQGKRGDSKPSRAAHVYSIPLTPTNLTIVSSSMNNVGINVVATWNEPVGSKINDAWSWYWHPIDDVELEWVISNPASGMAAPSNLQGSVIRKLGHKEKNSDNINIEQTLNANECLYLRVRALHDEKPATTEWVRASQLQSFLSSPSFSNYEIASDNKTVEVFADNSAADKVVDSFLAVSFRSTIGNEQSDPIIIGVIENDEDSTIVKCPVDLTGIDEYGFGVQALAYVKKPSVDVTGVIAVEGDLEKSRARFALLKSDLYIQSGGGYIPVSGGDIYDQNQTYYAKYDISVETDPDGEIYKVYHIGDTLPVMKSSTIWKGGEVPKPPRNLEAVMNDGVATVSWDWTWSKATGVELTWADHRDAWESTEPPQSYTISKLHATTWYIHGLSSGVTWYIRARFIQEVAGAENAGPWSEIKPLDLSAAPKRPTLNVSKGNVTANEDFIASWEYTSLDGTEQQVACIWEVYLDPDGEPHYGSYILASSYAGAEFDSTKEYYALVDGVYTKVVNPVETYFSNYYVFDATYVLAKTENGSSVQSLTLNPTRIGWSVGDTHLISLRLQSKSNNWSEFSPFVPITVVQPLDPPVVPNLDNVLPYADFTYDVYDDEGEISGTVTKTDRVLQSIPFTVNVTGAGDDGTTILVIERATNYFLARPDEDEFNGYKGETVAMIRHNGEGDIVIDESTLTGKLDDSAFYNLRVTIIDANNQTAESNPVLFKVDWDHQPISPKKNEGEPDDYDLVDIHVDSTYNVVKITPHAPPPEVLDPGDTFDIYRLSADAPELIVSNGTFETTYVDPYPTIGEHGGHRVVYKTKYDDYIDVNDAYTWYDYDEEDGDIIDLPYNTINYGNVRNNPVRLMYNVNLSSSWKKDFKETHYLGGSVQGDWNPAVGRTGSISVVVPKDIDVETIDQLRMLAAYPGVCQVRTTDGSNYSANVDVSESRSYDSNQIVSYNLNITRVDAQELSGMTEAEWNDVIKGV